MEHIATGTASKTTIGPFMSEGRHGEQIITHTVLSTTKSVHVTIITIDGKRGEGVAETYPEARRAAMDDLA